MEVRLKNFGGLPEGGLSSPHLLPSKSGGQGGNGFSFVPALEGPRPRCPLVLAVEFTVRGRELGGGEG